MTDKPLGNNRVDNARTQWMGKVLDNSTALRNLVANYHPAARQPRRERMPITAAAPEAACEFVRQQIRSERSDDPVARWDKAMSEADISQITALLEEAWFGVPESTACWNIPGFDIACDLMDDPPEESEEPHDNEDEARG